MKYTISKYYLNPKYLYVATVLVFIVNFIISKFINEDAKQPFEVALMCFYFILFLWSCFDFFVQTYDSDDIADIIKELEEEKANTLKYDDVYEKEDKIVFYNELHKLINDKDLYIHSLKTKTEFTSIDNSINYFIIFVILLIGQHSFDYLNPLGPLIILGLLSVIILFCVYILIMEFLKFKGIVLNIILGHIFLIYAFFSWGKNSYIRNFGDEIIGSYFEKSEYTTKYYVNVFENEDRAKNYRLPAEIHIYIETDSEDVEDDRFGYSSSRSYSEKHIVLKKIFWPNGGFSYFDDCDLELEHKILCTDQNDNELYIELTNQKVK